ncbi:MAG: hypothetical protein GX605_00550 [Chloroflexi bacterium]|nr:hypothetical protein [Chloroflexota bacterium]
METMRERLEEELRHAQEELETLERRLDDRPEFSLGEGSPNGYEWEMNLARRIEVQAHITELHAALQRVQEGTYGRCRRCGQAIDPERLAILPTTLYCPTCAREADKGGGG